MMDTHRLLSRAAGIKRLLTTLLVLLGAAVPGSLIYAAFYRPAFERVLIEAIGYPNATLALWQFGALLALAVVHILALAVTLWHGRQVFAELLAERIERAAHHARKVSMWLWGLVGYSIFAHTTAVLTVTWTFPEGERALAISLSSVQVSTVLAALMASLFAQALQLGAELWRDHKEVI
ncbi:MAG: hypothetical protein AAGJ34_08795 [Pseudomonadota bacterium]